MSDIWSSVSLSFNHYVNMSLYAILLISNKSNNPTPSLFYPKLYSFSPTSPLCPFLPPPTPSFLPPSLFSPEPLRHVCRGPATTSTTNWYTWHLNPSSTETKSTRQLSRIRTCAASAIDFSALYPIPRWFGTYNHQLIQTTQQKKIQTTN